MPRRGADPGQRALLTELDGVPPSSSDLLAAVQHLEAATRASPRDSGTWYLLASTLSRLDDHERARSAIRRGARLDAQAPLQRYAAGIAPFGPVAGADWSGLGRVYSQWVTRYPRRAEWHVAAIIAACEGHGDQRRAFDVLECGLAADAEPRLLLSVQRAQIAAVGRCPTNLP